MPLKADLLNDLADEELQSVIEQCNGLLTQRDRERKDKALEQARTILAGAGLNLRDVAAGKAHKNGNGKPPSYQGGRTYQHPTDKSLVWTAKGQKPNWLRDLEMRGGRAVEVPANDNFPASAKKTG